MLFLPCLIILYRGGCLDPVEASTFQNLRKFTFRLDDLDETELQGIRNVIDRNGGLKHLTLGGPYTDDEESWDSVFESATIDNLIHLGLFIPNISGFVLDRVARANNLQSLTVHGSFGEPEFASQVFATTRLPDLESFAFIMEDGDEDLYASVTWHFLRKREKLQRLDLGSCPWDVAQDLLPTLINLRVLGVCVDELEQIETLVESIPTQMVAIRLSVEISDSDSHLVYVFPYSHAVKETHVIAH